MLSKSSKYALKAVLYLSLHSNENKKIQVREISDNIEVPKAYTGKLLQALAKRDIISSSRGPTGGFYMTPSNRSHSVMDVVEVIDGRKKMESCLLGLQDCDLDRPCLLHNLVNTSRSQIIHVFESIELDELANKLKDKSTFLPI